MNAIKILTVGIFAFLYSVGLSAQEDKLLTLDAATAVPKVAQPSKVEHIAGCFSADVKVLEKKAFIDFPNLKHLSIFSSISKESYLSSIQAEAFAGLNKLTHLYLSQNRLTTLQPGVFSGLSQLTHLSLDYNQLSNIDKKIFANLSALRYLRLGHNQLSSIDEELFIDLTSLEFLSLGANPLTDLSPACFYPLKNLKILELYDTKLDEAQRAELQKALKEVLPNCRIRYDKPQY